MAQFRVSHFMDDFDHLDSCVAKWSSVAEKRRTREQQAVLDVDETIAVIEGDGLHGFWSERGAESDRIIESFRLAGVEDVADLLTQSSFCREVFTRGLDPDGHWSFTDAQDALLHQLESQITERGPDGREALLRFLPRKHG